ncbi:MAG TPA: FISUMP domain-containing protein [Bacteroidales bacterium]|nr:FISUMP domain-containing protein [Bacteroidales bacterium]HNS47735.1 FISUMP domain-containing protein [Bacteroidales bacterium]
MSEKIILVAFFAILSLGLYSQRPTIELTFTAVDSAAYVRLDSIRVMNRTQGSETLIYWPDTTLSLEINPGDWLLYVGYATFSIVDIPEENDDISSFSVYQNYPNPMGDRSEISMYIPEKGKVQMMITDLQGKIVLRTDRQLDGGHHSFRFIPGGGHLYFLTANWNGISRSIKMISTGPNDGKRCRLDYIGGTAEVDRLKTSLQTNDFIVRESGILDNPEESATYTFRFATNIPCPGTPAVEYEGQVYNTIQIFSQCWLKENLNVGEMIEGTIEQSNNGTIEKYCYNNEPDSCTKYGGLYQWNEMMQYTIQQGTRGICPPGWHLPTDEEWKVLEGAVDSQYGIGDPEWDIYYDYRGFDAGTNLKTTSGWYENGNGTDLFGFSGLPGGRRYLSGNFGFFGIYCFWWVSTEDIDYLAWDRDLYFDYPEVNRYYDFKGIGFSVRCLRDECEP